MKRKRIRLDPDSNPYRTPPKEDHNNGSGRKRLFDPKPDPNIRPTIHNFRTDTIHSPYFKIVDADDTQHRKLSTIETRFCRYYTSHYNPTRAAIEAGYAPGRAAIQAKEILRYPRIVAEVKRIESERLARITYDGDVAARINWLRAYHPRLPTIFDSYIPCCRHCYGTNFEYQRTHSEFEEDYETYVRSRKKNGPFDERGGSNYDESLPPNPACPNCRGEGLKHEQRLILKDVNHLSPEAHALISGIKMKDGKVEQIIFHDVSAALDHLKPLNARWLELTTNSTPVNLENLSVEQMEQLIEEGRQLGFLTDEELE